jgi:hypothetical protein
MIDTIKRNLQTDYTNRLMNSRFSLRDAFSKIERYLMQQKGISNLEAQNITEDIISFIEIASNTSYLNSSQTRRQVKQFFDYIRRRFKGTRGY